MNATKETVWLELGSKKRGENSCKDLRTRAPKGEELNTMIFQISGGIEFSHNCLLTF